METDFVQYVRDSDLSPEDKETWEDVFDITTDDQLDILSEFLDVVDESESSENPENIKSERLDVLTENLKLKQEALRNKDMNLVEQILEQEENYLNKF